MKFVLFCRSVVSDWHHADAHFLRGICTELVERGHDVAILEPADGWSLRNLREQCGGAVVKAFHATYPRLECSSYHPDTLDLDEATDGADVVIVHDRNDLALVARIGRHRAETGGYRLLFHDTNPRVAGCPEEHRPYHLADYDGVLAGSEALRRLYEERGWADSTWTWHQAADVRVFRPLSSEAGRSLDLVWEGYWANGERLARLVELLIDPVGTLGLRARVYGWRYPEEAVRVLQLAGIDYAGWIANFCLPAVFATARCTIDVPQSLPGGRLPEAPSSRLFEALACRTPLVSGPWNDTEGLFEPGADYLVAADGVEMRRHLRDLQGDPALAEAIAARGQRTVLERHTCAHRAEELLAICRRLGTPPRRPRPERADAPSPRPAAGTSSWWATA